MTYAKLQDRNYKNHNLILTAAPSLDHLIQYLKSQNQPTLRRDIARAFGIKGEKERRFLKTILSELVEDGRIHKRGKSYFLPGQDSQRDSIQTANSQDKPSAILGILQKDGHRVLLAPLDRRDNTLYLVEPQSLDQTGASIGDYVRCEQDISTPQNRRQNIVAVTSLITKRDDLVRNLSALAIRRYDIPDQFPDHVIQAAAKHTTPKLSGDRQDIRDIPLVTIDDSDARDHDDAVYAEPDQDENNPGGWRILVAIADVAHFVKPGSDLDKEAFERGNSTYFPDKVVPMLPEKLSNDLCSLVPNQDRPCMAVWMRISKYGKLLSQKFFKGMMRSHAKLTYKGVQNYHNQQGDSGFPPNFDGTNITNLYKAYGVLKKARAKRGTLDLDLPEQRIFIGEHGAIEKIEPRERLDAHQLIEEFMVLANVAAAHFITSRQKPCLFRVHDTPAPEKVEELGTYLKTQNMPVSINRGTVLKPVNFTQILMKIAEHPLASVINQMVLRSQSRAEYTPENLGHFGLNLTHYAHFTSPIRRYADLTVHRALEAILEKKPALYPYDDQSLAMIGEHISETERRSAKAERETIDRYVALHLEDRSGETFAATISGMTDFAIFLTLNETKTDGILPYRNLGGDYFTYDHKSQSIRGRRSKRILHLGDALDVTLEFANPISGSVVFSAKLGPDKETKLRKYHKTKKVAVKSNHQRKEAKQK